MRNTLTVQKGEAGADVEGETDRCEEAMQRLKGFGLAEETGTINHNEASFGP